MKLLTRDEFRDAVMKRDHNKCVMCGSGRELAVHHIIERKLWKDGGYYIDNGVTLCPRCHILAEQALTFVTCGDLRCKAGIQSVIMPEGFDKNCTYDKWGNKVLDTCLYEYNERTIETFKKVLRRSGVVIRFVDSKFVKEYHDIDIQSKRLITVDFLVPSLGKQGQ